MSTEMSTETALVLLTASAWAHAAFQLASLLRADRWRTAGALLSAGAATLALV